MKKFSNPLKKKFIGEYPDTLISTSDINNRCKFNLSFFDNTQEHGSDFSALTIETLSSIQAKIVNYTTQPLNYWRNKRCGSQGLKIYEDYPCFPKKTNFTFPKFVPNDAHWGRFRIDNLGRLVGFTIPGDAKNKEEKGEAPYDLNTFYLVFIDLGHNFYLTEKK